MRKINLIVVHCSATRTGTTLSPSQLDEMHRLRGFDGMGYHYYIRRDGTLVTGRSEERMGAHVRGYNAYSIGICYEGGLDAAGNPKDTRTAQQRVRLRSLIEKLVMRYPLARVRGHRDLSPDVDGNGRIDSNEWIKMCPCFEIRDEYECMEF